VQVVELQAELERVTGRAAEGEKAIRELAQAREWLDELRAEAEDTRRQLQEVKAER
jgi:hypothetical protein